MSTQAKQSSPYSSGNSGDHEGGLSGMMVYRGHQVVNFFEGVRMCIGIVAADTVRGGDRIEIDQASADRRSDYDVPDGSPAIGRFPPGALASVVGSRAHAKLLGADNTRGYHAGKRGYLRERAVSVALEPQGRDGRSGWAVGAGYDHGYCKHIIQPAESVGHGDSRKAVHGQREVEDRLICKIESGIRIADPTARILRRNS
jgi:hypothetical protein